MGTSALSHEWVGESRRSLANAPEVMTLSIYSSLMKVYAFSGLYDKACDLYEDIQKDKIEPDAMMHPGTISRKPHPQSRAHFLFASQVWLPDEVRRGVRPELFAGGLGRQGADAGHPALHVLDPLCGLRPRREPRLRRLRAPEVQLLGAGRGLLQLRAGRVRPVRGSQAGAGADEGDAGAKDGGHHHLQHSHQRLVQQGRPEGSQGNDSADGGRRDQGERCFLQLHGQCGSHSKQLLRGLGDR